jgi:hypothetical protein
MVRDLERQEGQIKGYLIYTDKPAPAEKKQITLISGELQLPAEQP